MCDDMATAYHLDKAFLKGGTIGPAYGRDYRSKAAAVKAFRDGVVFYLYATPDGPTPRTIPCSIRDFSDGCQVTIRYARLTRDAVIHV